MFLGRTGKACDTAVLVVVVVCERVCVCLCERGLWVGPCYISICTRVAVCEGVDSMWLGVFSLCSHKCVQQCMCYFVCIYLQNIFHRTE